MIASLLGFLIGLAMFLAIGAAITYGISIFIIGGVTNIWEWSPGGRVLFAVSTLAFGWLALHIAVEVVDD